jgi:hypothetical protein
MWNIHCLKNSMSIKLNNDQKIFLEDEIAMIVGDTTDNYLIHICEDNYQFEFESEDMEHMDYFGLLIQYTKVFDLLNSSNGEGEILFGSLEGDNAGEFWGYRFDPHHKLQELQGNVTWKAK